MGGRYHVYSIEGRDLRLLATVDGFVFAADRGLGLCGVDGGAVGVVIGAECNPQPPTGCGFDSSHGSRRAVCGEQISGRAATRGDVSEHERGGKLLRQRIHGIVLRDDQDGVGVERVCRSSGSGAGAIGLRALLQCGTSSFIAGIRLPGGL